MLINDKATAANHRVHNICGFPIDSHSHYAYKSYCILSLFAVKQWSHIWAHMPTVITHRSVYSSYLLSCYYISCFLPWKNWSGVNKQLLSVLHLGQVWWKLPHIFNSILCMLMINFWSALKNSKWIMACKLKQSAVARVHNIYYELLAAVYLLIVHYVTFIDS